LILRKSRDKNQRIIEKKRERHGSMKLRRILAGALIALGALLMFAAAEAPAGPMVVALGIAIGIAGIALDRRAHRHE
jgi:hypothetical protein